MHSLRSAAMQYTNYGTGGAFELPTQSGTYIYIYIYLAVLQIHVAIELTQLGESGADLGFQKGGGANMNGWLAKKSDNWLIQIAIVYRVHSACRACSI